MFTFVLQSRYSPFQLIHNPIQSSNVFLGQTHSHSRMKCILSYTIV